MPVEGEVWWDPEEPTQAGFHSCGSPQPDCFSQYHWSYTVHDLFPNHGFAIRIGRHVLTADPFSFVMSVSDNLTLLDSTKRDRIIFEVVGSGQDCPSPITNIDACHFILELDYPSDTFTDSSIPSSAQALVNSFPGQADTVVWSRPPLEVIFTINDGQLIAGAPEVGGPQDPILPLPGIPGEPGWKFPDRWLFPPGSPGADCDPFGTWAALPQCFAIIFPESQQLTLIRPWR